MFGKVGRTSNLSYVKETASLAKGNASRTIGTINQKASSDTCEFSTTTPKKPSLIQRAKNASIKLFTDDPIKTDVKKLLKKDINVDGSYKSPSEIAEVVCDPQNKEIVNTKYFQSKLAIIKSQWTPEQQSEFNKKSAVLEFGKSVEALSKLKLNQQTFKFAKNSLIVGFISLGSIKPVPKLNKQTIDNCIEVVANLKSKDDNLFKDENFKNAFKQFINVASENNVKPEEIIKEVKEKAAEKKVLNGKQMAIKELSRRCDQLDDKAPANVETSEFDDLKTKLNNVMAKKYVEMPKLKQMAIQDLSTKLNDLDDQAPANVETSEFDDITTKLDNVMAKKFVEMPSLRQMKIQDLLKRCNQL